MLCFFDDIYYAYGLLWCMLQVPLSKLKDSFNDGTSIAYIEELEQRYKADPSSVDKTWGMFFKALGER
jgi:hypothetical protein